MQDPSTDRDERNDDGAQQTVRFHVRSDPPGIDETYRLLAECDNRREYGEAMQLFQQALLHASPDSYSPSEAFQALRDAALRKFPFVNDRSIGSSNDGRNTADAGDGSNATADTLTLSKASEAPESNASTDTASENMQLAVDLTETLRSFAILVCKVVGPAWTQQLRKHRDWLQRHRTNERSPSPNTQASRDDVPNTISFSAGGIRHRTARHERSKQRGGSESERQFTSVDKAFPYVPERVPSALLHFVASLFCALIDDSSREHHRTAPSTTVTGSGQHAINPDAVRTDSYTQQQTPNVSSTDNVRKSAARALSYILLGMLTEHPPSIDTLLSHDMDMRKNVEWLPMQSQSTQIEGIPVSSQGSVSRILSRFVDLVDETLLQSTIDWRFVSGMLSIVDELASNGVHVSRHDAARSVPVLVRVAESSMAFTHKVVSRTDFDQEDICDDVVAAFAGCARATSLLTTLGNNGNISAEWLSRTTKAMLHIHVTVGVLRTEAHDDVSVLSSSIASPVSQSNAQRTAITAQIDSCFTETSDMLWSLLANPATAVETLNTLFSVVEQVCFESLDRSVSAASETVTAVTNIASLEAGTAIRVISAAQWGQLPGTSGISHLQMFWSRTFHLFRSVTNRVHASICTFIPLDSSSDSSAATDRAEQPLLYIAMLLGIEILSAVGSFIDRELHETDGRQPIAYEDGLFVDTLIRTVGPWLKYDKETSAGAGNGGVLISQGRKEAESVILRLCAVLDQSVHSGALLPPSYVASHNDQTQLFDFLLHDVVTSMDAAHSDVIGVSTFRAWIKFGLFPFRLDAVSEVFLAILANVFEQSVEGAFMHSAKVRLDALWRLTHDNIDANTGPGSKSGRSIQSESSYRSNASLLSIARYHSVFRRKMISDRLVPLFSWLLKIDSQRPDFLLVQKLPTGGGETNSIARLVVHHKNKTDNERAGDEYQLQKYCIHMIGKLARDPLSSKRQRLKCLEILRTLSMDSTRNRRPPTDGVDDGSGGESDTFLNELRVLGSHRFSAVREVASCVSAAFTSSPNLQPMLPKLFDVLCSIVLHNDTTAAVRSEMGLYEPLLLALVATMSLSRLRVAKGGYLAYLSRRDAVCHIPDEVRPYMFGPFQGSVEQRSTLFVSQALLLISEPTSPDGNKHNISSLPGLESKQTMTLRTIFDSFCKSLENCSHLLLQYNTDSFLRLLVSTLVNAQCAAICSYVASGFCASYIHSLSLEVLTSVIVSDRLCIGASAIRLAFYAMHLSVAMKRQDIATVAIPKIISFDGYQYHASRTALRLLASTVRILNGSEANVDRMIRYAFDMLTCVHGRSTQEPSRLVLEDNEADTGSVSVGALSLIHEAMQIRGAVSRLWSNDVKIAWMHLLERVVISNLGEPNYLLYLAIRCTCYLSDILSRHVILSIQKSQKELPLSEGPGDDTTQRSTPSLYDVYMPQAAFMTEFTRELLCNRLDALDHANTEPRGILSNASRHRQLLTEYLHIAQYKSIDANGNPARRYLPTMAWLGNDSVLLTFRVGSPYSQFRGWLEIIVRSPTSRRRSMVRLCAEVSLRSISLGNYPFTDGGSSGNSVSTKSSTGYKSVSSMTSQSMPLPAKLRRRDRSDVETEAKALLTEIDTLLAPEGNDLFDPLGRWSNHSIQSVINHAEFKDDGGINDNNKNSDADPPQSSDEDISIQKWLRSSICRDVDDYNRVRSTLNKMGVSDEMLSYGGEDADDADDFATLSGVGSIGRNRTTEMTRAEMAAGNGRNPYLPIRRLVPGPKLDQAISMLDRKPPYMTHKVALLCAGAVRFDSPNESAGGSSVSVKENENFVLRHTATSPEFHRLATGLGSLVPTQELLYFSGGLDTSPYQSDGTVTRVWISDGNGDCSDGIEKNNEGDDACICAEASRSVVVFHDVTWMPKQGNGTINNRKRHIGNDTVWIVYVEQDSPVGSDIDLEPFEMLDDEASLMVSGQFGFATIYVSPLFDDSRFYRVCTRIRRRLPSPLLRDTLLHFAENEVIPVDEAPRIIRSLAIRIDLACRSILDTLPPPFPGLERYLTIRQLKRIAVKR